MALPISFAPLQGLTEDPFRKIFMEICGGVDEYYTPFLRLEHGEIRKKDNLGIRPEFNVGVPLVLQVIARDGAEFNQLLDCIMLHVKSWKEKKEMLSLHGSSGMSSMQTWADAERICVDVNMGCPFALQVDHGRGAGLLSNADKVREVCSIMERRPEFQFSVKMRLGVTAPDEWHLVLPVLNEAPLHHITLHPRVATQQYTGLPNMDEFRAFAKVCEHPLVYNGDLKTVDDIVTMEREFPHLAGVMLGRGLLARPTLAQEYKMGVSMLDEEVVRVFKRLHASLYRYYSGIIPNDQQLLSKLRCFWDYAEPLVGKRSWKKIHKAGNMRNFLNAIDDL